MSSPNNGISHGLIQQELDNICGSPLFRKSEKLRSILRYLVTEALAGRGESLKGYNVAVEALGREEGFDPSTDSIIRAQIHRLRAKLDSYYQGEGKASKVHIRIPMNCYNPQFLEPEALAGPEAQTPAGRRKQKQSTILVLPFVNSAADGKFNFLSTRLSGQLAAGLSKFPEINVLNLLGDVELAAQASMHKAVSSANARFLLEGGYLAVQENIRVDVRLTDVENSLIIWAEVMDYPIQQGDLLQLEDRIISSILSLLVGDYGKITQYLLHEAAADNPEQPDAFAAIQRYYSYTVQNMFPRHADARLALEFCLENVRPCPPLAYAALGELYLSDYKAGFDSVPDAVTQAEALINKAFEMDPSLQNILLAKANLEFINRNHAQFEQYLMQAIAANPNHYPAVAAAYGLYARAGHWEEGCRKLRDLYQNIRTVLPYWYHLCFFLYSFKQQDYRQALSLAGKCKINDYHQMSPYYLLAVNAKLNNPAQVEESLRAVASLPLDRTGKIERILYCASLDEQLNEDILSTLGKYGIA